jgi:hypothetical protein
VRETGSLLPTLITSSKLPGKVNYKTCTLGIITMGNLPLEIDLTLVIEPAVKKTDISPTEKKTANFGQ